MVEINYDLVDNKAKSKIITMTSPLLLPSSPHQEDGGNNILLGSWGNLQVGSL